MQGQVSLAERYAALRQQLRDCALAHHRNPDSIGLLAASKRQSVATIQQLVDLGQHDFAENTIQEALPKIQALSDQSICWHFIGRIQSNKTKSIAEHFDWVHSMTDARIAQRLNDARPANMGHLNVYIQVNISDEDSKAGVGQADIYALAAAIALQPRLKLRGLMTMTPKDTDSTTRQQIFAKLAQHQKQLTAQGIHTDSLSMGMSSDYQEAIAKGSTCVRIGSALFDPTCFKS
jgi:PLP dependent protein